jgi:hypothetical protein
MHVVLADLVRSMHAKTRQGPKAVVVDIRNGGAAEHSALVSRRPGQRAKGMIMERFNMEG